MDTKYHLLKRIILYFFIFILINSWFFAPSKNVLSKSGFYTRNIFLFYAKLCQIPAYFTLKILPENMHKKSNKKNPYNKANYRFNLLFNLFLPISLIFLFFNKKSRIFYKMGNKIVQIYETFEDNFLTFIKKLLKFIYMSSRVKYEKFIFLYS